MQENHPTQMNSSHEHVGLQMLTAAIMCFHNGFAPLDEGCNDPRNLAEVLVLRSVGKHSVPPTMATFPVHILQPSGVMCMTQCQHIPKKKKKNKTKAIYMCCFHQRTHAHKDKHTIKANKSVLGCSGEPHFKTLFLL